MATKKNKKRFKTTTKNIAQKNMFFPLHISRMNSGWLYQSQDYSLAQKSSLI